MSAPLKPAVPKRKPLNHLLVVALAVVVGCDSVETDYGHYYGKSINGTGTFAEILRAEGMEVRVRSRLSQRLAASTDVLIVFLPHPGPIDEALAEWIGTWLDEYPLSHAILVLHDWDAQIPYWEWVLRQSDLDEAERAWVENQLDQARKRMDFVRNIAVERNEGNNIWYSQESVPVSGVRKIDSIQAQEGFLGDLASSPGKLELYANRRLVPDPEWSTPVVWSEEDVLVADNHWHSGKLTIVANGSFLLNAALVNPENRKLAWALGRSFPPKARVVILEFPFRIGEDAEVDSPSFWAFLGIHPIGWIFGQLLVLGLAYVAWKAPIFGRPIPVVDRRAYRFGAHIEALGTWIARSSVSPEHVRRTQEFNADSCSIRRIPSRARSTHD